jgi:multidrug efflux pump subunit AcrB
MGDVFGALQATLGGFYVNDFNLFGRTWQVNLQAEAADRDASTTSGASMCATARGRDGAAARLRRGADRCSGRRPSPLQQLRSVTINGAPAPGISSGDALAAMEHLGATLPRATAIEWTGTAFQEKQAAGQTDDPRARRAVRLPVPGRAVRSWTIPVPVLLSVAVGVLGSLMALWVAGCRSTLCADRPRGADRARGQERHPDRRIRQGARRRAAIRRPRSMGARCASAR